MRSKPHEFGWFHARRYPRNRARPRARRRARRVARRARRSGGRPSRRRCRRVRALAAASSTRGRGSGSSRVTTSRRTRTSASAITAGSTACASRAGAARDTCAGTTRPIAAFCARSKGCARRPRRSARSTKPSAARNSSTSWTRAGTAAPTSVNPRETRADHRHHGPGRPPPVRVPVRQGLPGVRSGARPGQPQDRAGAGGEPLARAHRGRPARPLVAHRGRRAGAARRGLQPRRDQLRAALVQAGRADRGDHRPRRAAHARSGAHGRRHREQPDSLLPGVVVGDVRQGARDAADRDHAVPPAVARTASRRCSVTTRR